MINTTLRKCLLSLVASTAVLGGFGVAAGVEGGAVQETPSAQTDQVRFQADFQTGTKPIDVVGQWAWTSVDVTGGVGRAEELESAYSTEPQGKLTGTLGVSSTGSTEACVHGGALGDGCGHDGDRAGASTSGEPQRLDWEPAWAAIPAKAEASNVATGARCRVDAEGRPQVQGMSPTGRLSYEVPRLFGAGRETVDLGRLIESGAARNGESWSATYRVGRTLLGRETDVEFELTPRWGHDDAHRAYSEITVRYRGIFDGLLGGGTHTPWIEYTVRSECGLNTNGSTGSEGPIGVSPRAAAPMMARGFASELQEPPGAAETEASPAEDVAPPAEPEIAIDERALPVEQAVTAPEAAYPYLVASERVLTAPELDLVRRVLADVAAHETDRRGTTRDARWEIHPADGLARDMPVIAIELADGTLVTATPDPLALLNLEEPANVDESAAPENIPAPEATPAPTEAETTAESTEPATPTETIDE